MTTGVLQPAFVSGEVTPAVLGRVDVDREHVAATTMRNMFVDYRGGAKSRAGTAFVGFSKQTGRSYPPRLLPFQSSINQGLALEFGHHYMRVIYKGGFVTETAVGIAAASQAKPCVLTFGSQGATAAVPIVGGVTFSYAPGDLITLLGGTVISPAILQVMKSQLVSLLPLLPGSGYAVNNTVTLGGGTSSVSAIATVASIVSVEAAGSIAFTVNPADGDTVTLNGSAAWTFKTTPTGARQTQIQGTLAGTLAQLAIDLAASADALLTVASYSSTPTSLVVTYNTPGAGGNAYTLAASVGTPSSGTLTGGSTTGIGSLTVSTAGVFSALPVGGLMTQTATSGGGSGASFQTAVFGPQAVSVSNPGSYTALPANPVAQASSTGIGVGATFTVTWGPVPAFANGDWIYIAAAAGMTELDGNTYVVAGATATTAQLLDVYGNQVDSTLYGAYTGGGTAARIYTLATPYDERDLAYLKITQSANVMTICCVNQDTYTEYAPQNLSRINDTDWAFSDVVPPLTVTPPTSVTASISDIGGSTSYEYEVTAVSPVDGSESIPSTPGKITGISIATELGQVNLKWPAVENVFEYNIYKAQPSYGAPVPGGAQLGYIGSSYGTGFIDPNLIPDFAQVPPTHYNPFSPGQIIAFNIVTGGSKYKTATASIVTATGSLAAISLIIQGGAVVAGLIQDAGQNYAPGDTVTITGDGTGATAQLTIGPQSGTYPSVVSYFQQRRAFANSLNETDTYWMSQPGAFGNFDGRIPPIASDAIIGSPWSVEVNGIQWMLQTSGGLLVMTGLSAWLLAGAGSFATSVQPISPSSQDNIPQAFTGVSPTVPPVKINYDVIYVNSKGSLYYALPYQLYILSEPIDLTEMSSHLFIGYSALENAWCEQPNKVLWSTRSDGVMLSLTYYKSQAVAGWGRHDTNGLFVSTCPVIELPVDALYLATQRFPGGNTAYMVERMDNRIWSDVESTWCVDCGLALGQPTPNATVTASSAAGLGAITGVSGLVGGAGYSAATTASIIDDNGQGPGTGAVVALTIVAGVITAVAMSAQGSGYTYPALVIIDPANSGSGASAKPTLDTSATFTASNAVFGVDDVGSVIRMGGGMATITAYTDPEHVTASIASPITDLIANSGGLVRPQAPGDWTMTAPVSQVFGLDHLIGATVTGLADGTVITPRIVQANGSIALDMPASAVVIGLGFQAQLQGVYLDAGAPTIQGQRKKIAAGNVFVRNSRGLKVGGAQPDGSMASPQQIAPTWATLSDMPDLARPAYNSTVVPLYTGFNRVPVSAGFNKTGQVALQQDYPLPMEILSVVAETVEGDTPDQQVQPQQRRQAGGGQ